MKSKNLNKVLFLKKSTVTNLDSKQMEVAKGGYWHTGMEYSCYTWCGCDTNFYHCPTSGCPTTTYPID